MTPRMLAHALSESHPEWAAQKKQRSAVLENDQQLVAQIASGISSHYQAILAKYPQLNTTDVPPRAFYYAASSDEGADARLHTLAEDAAAYEADRLDTAKVTEHCLYPKLSVFAWREFRIRCCRIDEKRSSNTHGTQGNVWLHPDVVGLRDLGAHWHREVRDCVSVASERRTELWSFEVKLTIDRSNVRRHFFQTVSNSSWAHFGYLVAERFNGQGTLDELRMLSAAHGIGVIRLDARDLDESRILIPARERIDLDWDMINRLVEANADFRTYIKRLREFHQTGELRPADLWDSQTPFQLRCCS